MNTIRETIQETSKRIKRLGESSQEIGNIVELINDIAEQTNILALNASIQASMAGEAGRGFAVVADEVQRLAERAANATKQIEVLVRTIQTDTNEAVVSMERSTTDVVGGALLAENAGAALEEIEQVSNQIASLVQNISASARQQTGAAQNISRNMQVLQGDQCPDGRIRPTPPRSPSPSSPSCRRGCASPPPDSACPAAARHRTRPAAARCGALEDAHADAPPRCGRSPRSAARDPAKATQCLKSPPKPCDLVGRELNATLNEARAALESLCRAARQRRRCSRTAREQLHQVHGVLRAARGLRRGAARRGNGARHPLPARNRTPSTRARRRAWMR